MDLVVSHHQSWSLVCRFNVLLARGPDSLFTVLCGYLHSTIALCAMFPDQTVALGVKTLSTVQPSSPTVGCLDAVLCLGPLRSSYRQCSCDCRDIGLSESQTANSRRYVWSATPHETYAKLFAGFSTGGAAALLAASTSSFTSAIRLADLTEMQT